MRLTRRKYRRGYYGDRPVQKMCGSGLAFGWVVLVYFALVIAAGLGFRLA
jgi:hypothetical protein